MLGIDWIKILMHLVVFAVLMTGLTFLLYKPVLKFIKNRQEQIKKGLDDGQAMQQQAQAAEAEYNERLAQIEQERQAVLQLVEQERETLLEEARQEAQKERQQIALQARQEADELRRQATQQLQQEAGAVAVQLAEEILRREVRQEDNEQIIAECLQAWSDHD